MSFSHPNLISFKGAGRKDNNYFIVTEYIENGSLYDYLSIESNTDLLLSLSKSRKKAIPDLALHKILSVKEKVSCLIDIAHGLQYLHCANIIYRDLKCLNIIITNDKTCKLIDYGTVTIDDDRTKTTNIGSCCWMSPEILTSSEYSLSTDIFSFGMLMYELLMERLPYYEAKTSYEVSLQIRSGKLPTFNSNVPKSISKLAGKCWRKKPSKRPNIQAVLQSLYKIYSQL